jgi:hypothetical protein
MQGDGTERVFFFGCWNRDGCVEDRPDYRAAVLAAVRSDQQGWSRGLVAGDNIYPEKGNDKTKTVYMRTLESGFRMLTDVNVANPVVVGLGNHDVECADVLADMMRLGSVNLEVTHVGPSETFERLYLIDTNVDRQDDGAWADMIDGLDEWLDRRPPDEWLFVMGHEPIMALKQKKDRVCTDPLPRAERLLGAMSKRRCVYLCADVHNFQVGAFHAPGAPNPVFQVVSGTGGASPDPMKAFFAESPVGESGWKLRQTASMQPYGYCILDVPSKNEPLSLTYVMVAPSEPDHNSDSSGSDDSDSSTPCGKFGFTLGGDEADVTRLGQKLEFCRPVSNRGPRAACVSGNGQPNDEPYICDKFKGGGGGRSAAGTAGTAGTVGAAASLGLITLLCSATGAWRA